MTPDQFNHLINVWAFPIGIVVVALILWWFARKPRREEPYREPTMCMAPLDEHAFRDRPCVNVARRPCARCGKFVCLGHFDSETLHCHSCLLELALRQREVRESDRRLASGT